MNTWAILCLAMYLIVPWQFLEYAAEYRPMEGKWVWPFPLWFIIVQFIFWPVLVPFALKRNRRMVEDQHRKIEASKRG